jgi:pimeloyl-ACP methyl ester carboxylesterase
MESALHTGERGPGHLLTRAERRGLTVASHPGRLVGAPSTGGEVATRAARRQVEQRARLQAAEAEAFAHYGVDATSEPLVLADPQLTTRVVRLGSGPPTVLLHGGALTSTVWAPLLPHLPGRSLYLVDLPGCGLADAFDYRGVDLASHQTAFVGSVLDALELERAAVIGASMGGWFALRFTIERSARVAAAALITAPAIALPGAVMPVPMAFTSTWLGRRMATVTPPPSARMTRRMLATIGGDGSVAGAPDALFDALGAATTLAVSSVSTLDLCRWRTPHAHLQVTEDELATCPVPVLLVWGEDDKVQSPEAGAWAASLLPQGRLEVLPGGHGVWFEHPERCGRIVTEFLLEADRQQA